MADINYGSDPQNFARALEQMKELEAATQELDAKEQTLRQSEQGATDAIIDNSSAMQRAIEQTRQLTTATGALTTGVEAETSAVRANTAAWEAQVAVMREASSIGATAGRAAGRTVAPTAATTAATTAAETEAMRAPREERIVPQAPAQRAMSAEERSARASRLMSTYQPPVRTGQLEANRQLSRLQAERTASLPTAAPRQERLMLPPGRGPEAAGLGHVGAAALTGDASGSMAAKAMQQEATAAREAQEALARLQEEQMRSAQASTEQAAAQDRVNIAYNQSIATYADASTALSRNGALTTEFIQAFARGDVTLQEFTSQMTSTIGKFGGWAIAGGLVYGAYDAIKKLGEGAVQTQEGVQNLSRFIPSVASGPQRGQAESTFRNISQQMNVPISEVTSSMSVMARVFHNVADAGNAARAVLLAQRLDQIPTSEAQNYMTGIAQSLNLTGAGGGQALIGVVSSLNALQNQLGARVNQTLPALARAAPAAEAAGLSTPKLEALVGLGVRGGISGTQVGTALLRSMGNFAFTPASEATFRQYGITAQRGQYGNLIDQIQQRITNPKAGQELTGQQVQQLATALGGPLLGTRTLLPILEHINELPGAEKLAAHPPSATGELDKILGGVGEQARRLGVTLENIGSELESAGILEPVQLLLQAVTLVGTGIEHVLSPLQVFGSVISQLPGPLKDVLGVAAGFGALRLAANSNFGLATQQAIGRLPGLGSLRTSAASDAEAIKGTVARYRTFQIPQTEREFEGATNRTRTAAMRSQTARTQAGQDLGAFGAGSEEAEAAAANATSAEAAYVRALQSQTEIQERLVQEQSIVATLTSNELSVKEKINFIEEQQLAVAQQTLTEMREAVTAQAKVNVTRIKSGAGGGAGGGGVIAGAPGTGEGEDKLAAAEGRGTATSAFQQETAAEQAATIGATMNAEPAGSGAMQAAVASGVFSQAESANAPSEEEAAASLGSRLAASPAAGAVRAIPGAIGGLGASLANPFGLLIGSQLAGAVLPGSLGSTVSTLGATAGLGAIAAQMGGRGLGGVLAKGAGVFGLGGEGTAAGLSDTLGNPLFGAGAALTVAGATTQGTGGLMEGVGGGAAAGAAAGLAFAPESLGLSVLAGGLLGAGAHFLGNALGGGASSGLSSDAKARETAANALQVKIAGGTANLGAESDYASVFQGMLQGAYDNGNQTDAQKQQAAVQQAARQQVQLLKETGIGTATGQQAAGLLTTGIGAAATSASFAKDPYDIGQYIDTASSGLLAAASSRFQYQLAQASTNKGAGAALGTDTSTLTGFKGAINATVAPVQQDITSYRNTLDVYDKRRAVTQQELAGVSSEPSESATRKRLQSSLTGINKQISTTQTDLTQAKGELQVGKDAETQFNIQEVEQAQQDASAVLQQITQRVQDVATLASAQAGGSRLGQIQATITGAAGQLRAARTTPGLSPAQRQSSERQAQAAELQGQTQKTVQQASELQATQSVAASVIPSYDPVTQAQVALRNATNYYSFLKANAHAFDPSDINNALAARNQALLALADAHFQYNTSIISAQQSLVEAQNPANAAAQASAQITGGQQSLAIARNQPERLAAQGQIAQGQAALREAQQTAVQTIFQTTEAQQQGDPVAQALTAISAAQVALAQSLGPDQTRAAQLQLAQAQQQLHQATLQEITAVGDLKASQTNNVLKQDADRLAAAQKALATAIAGGYGKYTVQQNQTAVNQAVLQQTNDYVSQRLATIQYQQQTLQVSAQGALQELQGLSKLKNLTVAQRQQIGQEMYTIETNQDNTSLFDLTPAGSSVRIPTIYDVASAARRERTALRGTAHTDFGGINSQGSVQIGGATLSTTSGALNTYDPQVEAAVKALESAINKLGNGVSSTNTTNVHNHGSSVAQMERAKTRVLTRARSALARGT